MSAVSNLSPVKKLKKINKKNLKQIDQYFYLIRHSQDDTTTAALTSIGAEQTQNIRQYFKNKKVNRVISSPMLRCLQTSSALKGKAHRVFETNTIFESLAPAPVWAHKEARKNMVSLSHFKPATKKKQIQGYQQALRGFKKTINSISADEFTAIFTHGNLIKIWLCIALKIPVKKWIYFEIAHGSITTIRRRKDGRIFILGVSDCSFQDKVTY